MRTANQRLRDGAIQNLIQEMIEHASIEEYEQAQECYNRIYHYRLNRFLDKTYQNNEMEKIMRKERNMLKYYTDIMNNSSSTGESNKQNR